MSQPIHLRAGARALAVLIVTGCLICAAPGALGRAAADEAEPLSWLAGSWRGEKEGAAIEESWSERLGDNRMGMFRMVAGGSVRFYEFMTIEYADGEAPLLRIKHFSKGLEGWEEKDESKLFELTAVEGQRAVFTQRDGEVPTRLIYTVDASGELELVLEKERPEGLSRSEFHYRRQ